MTPSDFVAELAQATKEQIAAVVAPLLERIAVLESKSAIEPYLDMVAIKAAALVPRPIDGKDAAPVDIVAIAAKAAALVPRPIDGKDAPAVDLDVIAMKAAALVPRPSDGKDAPAVDLDAIAVKAAALIPAPQPGRDGKDADPETWRVLAADITGLKDAVEAQKALGVRDLPVDALETVFQDRILPTIKAMAPVAGRDGKDVDMAAVTLAIDAAVARAVSALPAPAQGPPGKDGESVVDIAIVRKAIAYELANIPAPRDGRDVDPVMLETIISAHVTKAVAALPTPKDGASVTLDDVAPLVEAEVTKAVSAIPKAKDGRGIYEALITHDGELALTFSDGGKTLVGPVVGAPGKDADMAALMKHAESQIALIPTPKDGAPGKDGLDGLGFEDLDVITDDEKCVIRFSRDAKVKEQVIPAVIDRGVYKPGVLYRKGAAVTAQGSLWIAQVDTRERPGDGTGTKFWRLAVKKGRDGRDMTGPTGGQS